MSILKSYFTSATQNKLMAVKLNQPLGQKVKLPVASVAIAMLA